MFRSDGGKLGSRKQYQRILHESYQFLVKFILEQQALELAKSNNKGNGSNNSSNNNNNAAAAGSKSPSSRKH